MPELPEVEATAQYLSERVAGATIRDVTILWQRTVAYPAPSTFSSLLRGEQIHRVFRRGKFVVIELRGVRTQFLLIHLRMSGSLDVVDSSHALHTHDRLDILLSSKKSIRFHDTRKFGRAYLYQTLDVFDEKLGIEPLEKGFTVDRLTEILQSRKGQVKPLLLNQKVIAGLGNIYVDEVLWSASIHPMTSASRIPLARISALHKAIQTILTEAITLLGTDFGDNVVHGGMYTPKVYGRSGRPCLRCSGRIERIVVGQRGTHICRKCQRR